MTKSMILKAVMIIFSETWTNDEAAHDPVQPGFHGPFGQPMPEFKGPPEGIFGDDIQVGKKMVI